MRDLILDTETTGLDPADGDRIIEIAALERIDGQPTGRYLHRYLDPERPVDPNAEAVHGMSWPRDLAGLSVWADAEDAVVDFLTGARLVAHTAAFDVAFIEAEMAWRGAIRPPDLRRLASVFCTRDLARERLPDLPSRSLDALLDHYGIDRSRREAEGHGALLDCQLLAQVYDRLLEEPV